MELRLPELPGCWDTCGACASGEVRVGELLVAVGDRVARDQPVLVLETDKTVLDIPAERAGRVVELCVDPGAVLSAGCVLLRLAVDG
ncbi:MAG TPA: lipoyl domain-containing protein [Gammaproteobacteria bacterium]